MLLYYHRLSSLVLSSCFPPQVDHLPPDYIPDVCLDDRSRANKKWFFVRHGFDGRKFVPLILSPRRNKTRAVAAKKHGVTSGGYDTPSRMANDKDISKSASSGSVSGVPAAKNVNGEKVKKLSGL